MIGLHAYMKSQNIKNLIKLKIKNHPNLQIITQVIVDVVTNFLSLNYYKIFNFLDNIFVEYTCIARDNYLVCL